MIHNYTKFKIRETKPEAGNLQYIRKPDGWSWCCIGKPEDDECNVLSNCVGYASGRFSEIYSELTGYEGAKYRYFNCDAEKFIERAHSHYPELEIGDTPRPGAIIVQQKGTSDPKDGCGHVAIVEKVINDNTIYTSESGWEDNRIFQNRTRTNKDGNQEASYNSKLLGFIYNPVIEELPLEEPVSRDISVNQVQVICSDLRIRNGAGLDCGILGYAKNNGIYNVLELKIVDDYEWFRIGVDQQAANDEDSAVLLPKEINLQRSLPEEKPGCLNCITEFAEDIKERVLSHFKK